MAEKLVISALKKKRAELAGQIDHITKQLEVLRADLVHIDGALHAFGYDDPDLIKAKDLARAARLFQRGDLSRYILDSLRVAPKGLTQAQMCTAIFQQKGWDESDKALEKRVKTRLNSALSKLMERNRIQRGPMVGRSRLYRIVVNSLPGSNSLSIPETPDGPRLA